MRLTLRTLLAYLDDRLSPANARELGQKIAKSPFATDLEERIKSVVRRRRLASDAADQKTIDPNLIAEYLDDQLTPELVALIEKEILASDFSLAEVAATHQILGLLSDPVELSPSLKERLYKLDPAVAAETEEHPSQTATAGANGAAWKPLAPQEVTQTRSPMILLAVMVLGWLALLATDSNLFELSAPQEVTEVQQVPGQNDKIGKQLATVVEGETAEDLTSGSVLEAATSPNANLVSDPGPSVRGAPLTAAEPTTTETSTTAAVATEVPGTSPTTVPPTMPPAAGTPPVTSGETASTATVPETAVQPQPRKVVYDVQDAETMVVLSDAQTQSWRWAASDGRPAGEQNWTARMTESIVGIAEPFEIRVTAIDVGWSALVLGSSLFRAASQSAGLELIEGRLLLQRAPSTNEPAPFALTAGGKSMTVSVPAAGKQVGLQVSPLPVTDEALPSDSPSVFDLVPLGRPCRITVFAVDTDVTVQRSGETVVVVAGSQLDWITSSDTNPPPKVAAVMPGWVLNATKPKSESTAKLNSSTASEFKNFDSVSDAASGVMENRNPQIAVYAAKLPVLTKSVDDLATTLLQSSETVVRKEAIAGLQSIMLTSPHGRVRINETLRNRLPEMDLDNAMKLLEGVSQVAAEDRFISSWLVGMLDNNRLALRELAIFNLEKLFNDRNGYFADDDSGRRDSAVRRWKRILDRNDGRLVTPNG